MPHKYRFSELKTFAQCPRKHHYNYVEEIAQPENKNLLAGTLFHEAVDLYYQGEDYAPVLIKYKQAVLAGVIDEAPDLLEEVLLCYIAHYADQDKQETIIANESNFISPLEEGDTISATIDRIVERKCDGSYVLRDTKTTFKNLKYTSDDVRYNQQLHWYRLVAENEFAIGIDTIEIDEVRLAKLERPPINQNGKPSADKRKLGLVTYDEYYNLLNTMGLQDAPEYKQILLWLEQRGHPLFQRVSVQLLDENITDAVIEDLNEMYHSCKAQAKFRIRGPLCNYCGYKELCNMDHFNPDEDSREILIQRITKQL